MFSNDSEIFVLARKCGLIPADAKEGDFKETELCQRLANFDAFPGKSRIVVCTCGSRETVACETGKDPVSRPVIPIKKEEIVDTNGAGDSFAGGFLAWFTKGASLEKCIDAGSYAASANLKTRGCAVPSFKPAFE